MTTSEILERAVKAKAGISCLSDDEKKKAILVMSECLKAAENDILEANRIDIECARGSISETMIDRLSLNSKRIDLMISGMIDVSKLPDPNGKILSETRHPNGMTISKIMIPMGVVGIIFESRPNVTSDAAVLCFKSSNVCVLRCGKEAYRTSKVITDALRDGLKKCSIDENAIQLVDDTSRESANEMMQAVGKIDLLIPRGGKGLIKACKDNAKVPCIETGTGICHIYVEKTADVGMAVSIIDNAKTSRPSVCNACEVCLVDKEIAAELLPKLYDRLRTGREHPVKFIVDSAAAEFIDGIPADDKSFDTEHLDYILSVCVVDDFRQAAEHVVKHSTHHSESIITNSPEAAEYFINNTDSAAVYVNASTRFTDGGEFGLGCEMGISTQKLHARGPMGLEEMMTYHYVVRGNGQVR